MKKKKSGKGNGTRVALIILCIVLGIILAVLLGGTIYANHLMNLMNRVEIVDETLSQEQVDELLSDETVAPDDTTPVINEEDIDWGNVDETVPIITESEHVINILLIGQDSRSETGRARSDSMILVTVNKEKKTITLTSLLRDLYVRIPGYLDNKLNAAYAAGGMELLNETLELNFGIRVDGNVEVNFARFPEVIDLLGGVDLELRQDEANLINRKVPNSPPLSAGMMHMDGDQALYYSRIRALDIDADFSRTNRQRKVIDALIEKFRNTKLTTLMGLLDDILPMLATDMTNAEIIGYATDVFPMLADCKVISQRVPADGEYYLAMIREMSCIVADMDAARALLRETMSEE